MATNEKNAPKPERVVVGYVVKDTHPEALDYMRDPALPVWPRGSASNWTSDRSLAHRFASKQQACAAIVGHWRDSVIVVRLVRRAKPNPADPALPAIGSRWQHPHFGTSEYTVKRIDTMIRLDGPCEGVACEREIWPSRWTPAPPTAPAEVWVAFSRLSPGHVTAATIDVNIAESWRHGDDVHRYLLAPDAGPVKP